MRNFAIVGFGFIGKRHADIIHADPNMHLLAICDINAEKSTAAEQLGARFYTRLDEMLGKEADLQYLVIATPNGLHAEHAMAGLDTGLNVIVEKPFALTVADAEAVAAKAMEENKSLSCVMQNRFSPPAVWLKSVVQGDRLGKIYSVHINCFWNRDDRYYKNGDWKGTLALDGGPLYTQFSHFVDILIWIFGDVRVSHASFRNVAHKHNTEFEDAGTVLFDIASGGSGTINYSTAVWNANMESSITVIGEKGSLRIGGQYMDRIEYCHIKDYEQPELAASAMPNDYGAYSGSASNHVLFYDAYLAGKMTERIEEAVRVTGFIEEVCKLRGR